MLCICKDVGTPCTDSIAIDAERSESSEQTLATVDISSGRLHCFPLLILSSYFENVLASGGRSHRLATAAKPGPQAFQQQFAAAEGLHSPARCAAHLSVSHGPGDAIPGSMHQQRHYSVLSDRS